MMDVQYIHGLIDKVIRGNFGVVLFVASGSWVALVSCYLLFRALLKGGKVCYNRWKDYRKKATTPGLLGQAIIDAMEKYPPALSGSCVVYGPVRILPLYTRVGGSLWKGNGWYDVDYIPYTFSRYEVRTINTRAEEDYRKLLNGAKKASEDRQKIAEAVKLITGTKPT